MIGHDCDRYAPIDAEKGDRYTCMCGNTYECVRTFPWQKWRQI